MKATLDARPVDTQTPNEGGFDTRPKAVKSWYNDLPFANHSELLRRVYNALRQVNRQPVRIKHRLHFLELAFSAFRHENQEFRGNLIKQHFPLPTAVQRQAALYIEIQTELIRGYRTILDSIVPPSKPSSAIKRRWYRKELMATLHRLVKIAGDMVINYRYLNRPVPERLWRHIHLNYRLAEKLRLTRKNPDVREPNSDSLTIIDTYKELLLETLLPMPCPTREQQEEVAETLPHWARLARITTKDKSQSAHHSVNLKRDRGTKATAMLLEKDWQNPYLRLLDTAALEKALKRYVGPRKGLRRLFKPKPPLSESTAKLLLDSWCTTISRRESRLRANDAVEVAAGITAFYRLCGGESLNKADDKPVWARQKEVTIAQEASKGRLVGSKDKKVDVWHTVYYDTDKKKPQPKLKTETTPIEIRYDAIQGQITDYSKGGCAIVVPLEVIQNVSVGMLIGFRPASAGWQLGRVARISPKQESMELGIQTLAHQCDAVVLQIRRGNDEQSMNTRFEAVIGKDDEGKFVLAGPTLAADKEGVSEMTYEGNTFLFHRDEQIFHSRYADVYHFSPLDDEALSHYAPDERYINAVPG